MSKQGGGGTKDRPERSPDAEVTPHTERLPSGVELGQVLSVTSGHLTVVDGPQAGQEIPFSGGQLKIGSAPDNDLILTDAGISRHHAVLESSADKVVVRDLGSTNGTYLGDVRIREAFLAPDTILRLAKTNLRFHLKPRKVLIPPSRSSRFGPLVGSSLKMRQVFGLLEWIAPTEVTVLINGPTGSGKELVARSVHEASPRAKKPFSVLDCSALDRELISSELFGHEPGAFTGATNRRIGVLEQAQGGTVFIDEVGELPLDLQPKLLRALEAREIRRLGGQTTISLDVRVVAATHRDLQAMVKAGQFREDLYYRLSQVKVNLPPLKERKEDIALLAQNFLDAITDRTKARSIAPEVLAVLSSHSYNGNVRELRNLVERAAFVCRAELLNLCDFMIFEDQTGEIQEPTAATGEHSPRSLAAIEREAILASLKANGNNKSRTARELGIALNTLKAKLRAYQIASSDEE
ncbi:MAG: sigma 54-interacting transcriptional regulator [Candidatus Riflebacteria bacterium]|nr:sigma 54-interacting transcriptional regulator [Candidatus Riflebacteria bacterium]